MTGDVETPNTRVVRSGAPGLLWLMVLGPEQLASYQLPSRGAITLGRSPKCDVPLAEKSISRQHAILHIEDAISIEDLESANGTRVGGQRIPPHMPRTVNQGEVIELGDVSLLIQRRPLAMTPRRLWTHGYFEGRLDEECARAGEATEFGLVFVHCEGKPALDVVHAAIAAVLRPIDIAGEYGAGEFEVLLLDTSPVVAKQRAEQLVDELRERSVRARVGIACFPRDGRQSDGLIAHASSAARPHVATTPSGLIVQDPAMIQLRRMIERVAGGMLSVLLLGETGVGKEGLAELVHRRSPRAGKAFLRLNCAAVTETLLESELFGHEKGAFTGAVAAKPGLLETANGGTVFLDEIGEISPALQAKLLRVLEERLVMRVGGLKGTPIDVRFVAATNRDLEQEVARGRFRQDLYYRLAGITIVVPPLRERVVEIAPMARAFIASVAATGRKPQLAADTLRMLEAYAWPGNIRELRNVIERAVLLCQDGTIHPEHLPIEKMRATFATYRESAPAHKTPPESASSDEDRESTDPARRIDQLQALYPGAGERERIIAALEACRGNQTQAAQILGMSRRTLISRIERYGLPRPRKARG